jgi:hypothetical protein
VELTPEELIKIEMVASQLETHDIVQTLAEYLDREKALYEKMPENEEVRKSMLYGMACIVAAMAKLDPVQEVPAATP